MIIFFFHQFSARSQGSRDKVCQMHGGTENSCCSTGEVGEGCSAGACDDGNTECGCEKVLLDASAFAVPKDSQKGNVGEKRRQVRKGSKKCNLQSLCCLTAAAAAIVLCCRRSIRIHGPMPTCNGHGHMAALLPESTVTTRDLFSPI